MGASDNQRRSQRGGHNDDEMIEFGGLPVRWPFPRIHVPTMRHLPPAMRVIVTTALAALTVGLLIGFFGGRLAAHDSARHKARSFSPVSTPIVIPQSTTAPISLTGARCAVQVGRDLQVGVEIMNQTRRTVTLGAISPTFPLGGLRAVASGIGTCGALPPTHFKSLASLAPGGTVWIHTTLAVRLTCPEPLPVWFSVGYASAGKTGRVVLAAFPDLGPVSYQHCQTTPQNISAIIATVENGRGHSSRG